MCSYQRQVYFQLKLTKQWNPKIVYQTSEKLIDASHPKFPKQWNPKIVNQGSDKLIDVNINFAILLNIKPVTLDLKSAKSAKFTRKYLQWYLFLVTSKDSNAGVFFQLLYCRTMWKTVSANVCQLVLLQYTEVTVYC